MPTDHRGTPTGDNHRPNPSKAACENCGKTYKTKDMSVMHIEEPFSRAVTPHYTCRSCVEAEAAAEMRGERDIGPWDDGGLRDYLFDAGAEGERHDFNYPQGRW